MKCWLGPRRLWQAGDRCVTYSLVFNVIRLSCVQRMRQPTPPPHPLLKKTPETKQRNKKCKGWSGAKPACSPTGPGSPGNPLAPSSPFWPNMPCCPLGPASPSVPCGRLKGLKSKYPRSAQSLKALISLEGGGGHLLWSRCLKSFFNYVRACMWGLGWY